MDASDALVADIAPRRNGHAALRCGVAVEERALRCARLGEERGVRRWQRKRPAAALTQRVEQRDARVGRVESRKERRWLQAERVRVQRSSSGHRVHVGWNRDARAPSLDACSRELRSSMANFTRAFSKVSVELIILFIKVLQYFLVLSAEASAPARGESQNKLIRR